jgi:hypothetical protein
VTEQLRLPTYAKRNQIPYDLIAHTGQTRPNSPSYLSDAASVALEDYTASDTADREEDLAVTKLVKTIAEAQFLTNSTISQDQTRGIEEVINTQLARLAQKYLTLHDITFQERDQALDKSADHSVRALKSNRDPRQSFLHTPKKPYVSNASSEMDRITRDAVGIRHRRSEIRNPAPPTGQQRQRLPLPSSIRRDSTREVSDSSRASSPSIEFEYLERRIPIRKRSTDDFRRIEPPHTPNTRKNFSNSSYNSRPSGLKHGPARVVPTVPLAIHQRQQNVPPLSTYPNIHRFPSPPALSPPAPLPVKSNLPRQESPPLYLEDISQSQRSSQPAVEALTYVREDLSGDYSETLALYREQALTATDQDLRDMQVALCKLSEEEMDQMNASELDPIAYYFAYLKERYITTDDEPTNNVLTKDEEQEDQVPAPEIIPERVMDIATYTSCKANLPSGHAQKRDVSKT